MCYYKGLSIKELLYMANFPKALPDYELLHELFEVTEDGIIIALPREPKYWINPKTSTPEKLCEVWNEQYAFKEVFYTLGTHGYYQGKILNDLYLKHRVIFKMFYGYDPRYIDHIDGNKKNNKLINLRDCSEAENLKNQPLYSKNKSGYNGISKRSLNSTLWNVVIGVNGKQLKLGSYKNLEEAIKVRKEAEIKYGYKNTC